MSKRNSNPPAVGSSSPVSPAWIDLPTDVTANILQRLGAVEILSNAQNVCTTWRAVCKDPATWRVIDIRRPPEYSRGLDLMGTNAICRRAVDLSQGQSISIHVEDLEERDPLLNKTLLYVCNRSRNLRRLSLENCSRLSGKALTRAVERLAVLEELHLVVVQNIHPRRIKTIGNSRPTLKSFTFNLTGLRPPGFSLDNLKDGDFPEGSEEEDDEDEFLAESYLGSKYALAIAESMPNLRHLQLRANYMGNDGIQALLDGCPQLESLDIRQCYRVDLSGVLGDVCSQRIKDIKLPYAPVDDYEWYDHVPLYDYDFSDDYNEYNDFDLADVDMTGWCFDPDN